VEVVLSQDPIELIKVVDIQAAIDSPDRFTPSAEMIENYRKAPHPRQLQIVELLVHTSLDSKKTDIVRQNAMEVLRHYNELTLPQVKIEMAEALQQRISKKPLELVTVKVTYGAGILPYLKQKQVAEFFAGFLARFEAVGYHWIHHGEHGKLFDDFEDVGRLRYCPDALLEGFLLWMALCYLGERAILSKLTLLAKSCPWWSKENIGRTYDYVLSSLRLRIRRYVSWVRP
jgi:hypothetical protein